MIGSYSWSYDQDTTGDSMAKSGDTYCSSCAVDVSDVTIINSAAVSNGKLCAAFCLMHRLCSAHDFCWCCNGCRIDLHVQDNNPTERLYEQCSALLVLRVCD